VAWWENILTSIATSVKGWVDRHAQASSPRLVTIGTVKGSVIAASMRAAVKPAWQRWHQPDVETFLEWVRLGPLYCDPCQSNLTRWDTNEGLEQGMRCLLCGRVTRTEDIQRLGLQLTGQIRQQPELYWARYQYATASWADRLIVKTWVRWRSDPWSSSGPPEIKAKRVKP
jgi:hypothetical protein